MELHIENHKKGNGGYFSLQNQEEEIGRLTYTIMTEENTLIISYVMVYPKFEGQGMGRKLVEHAIEFARENQWKIFPHCSYAKSVLKRKTDITDIYP